MLIHVCFAVNRSSGPFNQSIICHVGRLPKYVCNLENAWHVEEAAGCVATLVAGWVEVYAGNGCGLFVAGNVKDAS